MNNTDMHQLTLFYVVTTTVQPINFFQKRMVKVCGIKQFKTFLRQPTTVGSLGELMCFQSHINDSRNSGSFSENFGKEFVSNMDYSENSQHCKET